MSKRRASNGGGAVVPSSTKKVKREADTLSADFPWLDSVMAAFDKALDAHTSITTWLNESYPGEDGRLSLADAIDRSFPPLPDTHYATTYDTGVKVMRLWQCNWSLEGGNRGLVPLEQLRNLVQVMLLKGVLTDPTLPGVEALVVTEPNAKFWRASPNFPKLAEAEALLGVGAICFIKGWTRMLAAHAVATLLIRLELIETVKERHPTLYNSLRAVHGNLPIYHTEEAKIDANRGPF